MLVKKILFTILFTLLLSGSVSANEFFLRCERGSLVKENNFKPIVWNFFKDDELLYVFDLIRVNGEYTNNPKRKYVVRTDRKNHLDWIKVTKHDFGYIMIYHSYFLDTNYMALYWTELTQDDFSKINDAKILLDNKKIDPLKFFKTKEEVFIRYWDFVSKNDQISALDTCDGTIYDFLK